MNLSSFSGKVNNAPLNAQGREVTLEQVRWKGQQYRQWLLRSQRRPGQAAVATVFVWKERENRTAKPRYWHVRKREWSPNSFYVKPESSSMSKHAWHGYISTWISTDQAEIFRYTTDRQDIITGQRSFS